MQAVIGNQLINAMRPADKPFEVRDAKLKGFLLRVQPSGAMSYIVEYARGKRVTLGKTSVLTPAQARDRAKEVLADVIKGEDPQAARKAAKAHTFKSFVSEAYQPWFFAHRRTGKATIDTLLNCFPDLQDKKLGEITPWLVDKWRHHRLKTVSPATVNRNLGALKAALSKAVEWGFIAENPLACVKAAKIDAVGIVRYLDNAEEARLLAGLDERETQARQSRDNGNHWRTTRGYPTLRTFDGLGYVDHLKPLVILAINTGLRRGELFALTWENVDLTRAMLTVKGATAKSGNTRHIPLNAEAIAVLTTWRKGNATAQGLVFPGMEGNQLTGIKTAFNRVLRKAGITQFRFHDLRHHFASRLVMAGVDLNTVRELLGHSDIKMTLRYAHLAPEHKAAAVARLIRPATPADSAPAELAAYRHKKAASGTDAQ